MSITFTEDDLILFIYGEANPILKSKINSALLSDRKLQEQFTALLQMVNRLEVVNFQPHDTSLKIIMEESALTQSEQLY